MSRLRRRIATVLIAGMLGAVLPASAAIAGPPLDGKACAKLHSLQGTIANNQNEIYNAILVATGCNLYVPPIGDPGGVGDI